MKPRKSQAMAEFAIVLVILLMVIYGMFEVGRLVFTYIIVSTASREAVRYGAATGLNIVGGIPRYRDCPGIRTAAQDVDFLNVIDDANITITYDHGPGTASFSGCPPATVRTNDRINVLITAQFIPIVPIVPLTVQAITSENARTLIVGLSVVGTSLPPPTIPPFTPPPTSTFTPSDTPTPLGTPTETVYVTPSNTPTPSDTPTPSNTPTITFTPSPTLTWTPTNTLGPSITPYACIIKHSGPIASGNNVTWTIYNFLYLKLEVSAIEVIWDSSGNRGLTEVRFLGAVIYPGTTYSGGGFYIPGGPWSLLGLIMPPTLTPVDSPTNTPVDSPTPTFTLDPSISPIPTATNIPVTTLLQLTFNKSTTGIRVIMTINDPTCSAPLDSSNPTQRYP